MKAIYFTNIIYYTKLQYKDKIYKLQYSFYLLTPSELDLKYKLQFKLNI